jgi:predicted Zn-ribbon and HTH transcriptional regulator
MDGLWDGLEKAGQQPDRLLLEWCSAAEGGRWQTIMKEAEKKRSMVTQEEIEQTQKMLAETKVPSPRNPRTSDENQPAQFACMRCGNRWTVNYGVNVERICPQCRSNSIRWLKD